MPKFDETSAYCPHCKKQVLARVKKYSTAPWLILGILSCGFFLLVWVVSKIIWQPEVRCSQCGNLIKNSGSAANQTNQIILAGVLILLILGGLFYTFGIIGSKGKSTVSGNDSDISIGQQKSDYTSAAPEAQKIESPANSAKSYNSGYEVGFFEGRRVKMSRKPKANNDRLEILAEKAADADDKSNNDDWIEGWIVGYKKGFVSK